MKDINEVTLLGHVGRDPEVKTFDNGDTLTRFSVATNRNWKNKNDEWVSDTSWHTVVVRGAGAERAARLSKGARVSVRGELSTRKVEKDGQTRYFTEVVVGGPAHHVADQTPRQQAMAQEAEHAPAAPKPAPSRGPAEPWEDDIPF